MYLKILVIILLFLFSLPLHIFSESASTTFPTESAGISAYVKVDNINEENNAVKLNEVQAFLEQKGTTTSASTKHVIGTIPINLYVTDNTGNSYSLFSISTNIYFDIDGWLVAYLHKEEPSSKIIQWTDYSPANLSPSILEEAIEKVVTAINHTHSPVNYYHFQHKDADGLAIVIDSTDNINTRKESHSITVPGEVHEASYSIYYSTPGSSYRCTAILDVDNNQIFALNLSYWCRTNNYIYNFYPENTFLPQTPSSVVFEGYEQGVNTQIRIGVGTLLIYSAD